MRIGPLPSPQIRELPGLADSSPIGQAPAAAPPPPKVVVGDAKPFSNILPPAVKEVDAKMQTASTETTKLLTGESTNVHQAVIAMQEAGVAFSLMVEVRNKLVDSYQELMRMQV